MSKSAKKRASKKVRDEAHEEEAPAAPTPVPPPPPKAKAKAASAPEPQQSQPKAKGKAKAAPAEPPNAEPKAEPKAKAKAEPEPPAPAPKAKGKAKAAPAPAPEPEAPAAPAPKAKAQGKQKAKAVAKPVEVEEEKPKEKERDAAVFVIDDGSGPAWETSSGLSKKADKRKQRAADEVQVGPSGRAMPSNQQYVVGMAPAGAQASAEGKARGPNQSVAADVERILAMKVAAEEKAKEPTGPSSSATIHVPENKIGIVIGPKGAKIKMIQEKCEVDRIDTQGQVFTITGKPENVARAEAAIKELIEKGYCALAFEGFSENVINVHSSHFPDLIGKQGAVVRKIKEELGVEINFQDVPKGSNKKAKVTLAGSATNVEKAKTVINNIIMYNHDELTHPGEVHEELDIEPWAYRYLIGSKGSEMKHIQHNWKVRVNIPREHSTIEKVIIVGEPDNVSRAKAYCEKLVWSAENNSKGRDKADNATADPWGDEEPEEEWMKGYMYKR